MSPLSDWIDLLVPATATKRTIDSNPQSSTYGDLTDSGTFPIGYQKLSSSELQRLGRDYGEDVFLILADLDSSGNSPVAKAERISIPGEGEMDVESVVPYKQPDERLVQIEAVLSS